MIFKRTLWRGRLAPAVVLFFLGAGAAWSQTAAPAAVTAGTMTFSPNPDWLGPPESPRPEPRATTWPMPAMAWDGVDGSYAWTQATLAALDGPGAPLLDVVPADIHRWCPAYPTADRAQRAAFWAGLVSTLAFYESTHNPRAIGGGGLWFGLVQISPATARGYACEVGTGEALLDGAANLRCGLRIMGVTVPRDGVIAAGMQGVAADWGPFHSSRKREGMRDWVSGQAYCLPTRMPEPRPAALAAPVPGTMPAPRPLSPGVETAAIPQPRPI